MWRRNTNKYHISRGSASKEWRVFTPGAKFAVYKNSYAHARAFAAKHWQDTYGPFKEDS